MPFEMSRLITAQFFAIAIFAYCRWVGGADAANGASEGISAGMTVEYADLSSDGTQPQQGDDPADIEDGSGSAIPEQMRLFQYDPVRVGHVYHVADETGRTMELVTAAVDPPIFEIRNYLSSEECDHVMELALEEGLERSAVVGELLPSRIDGNEDEILDIFEKLDVDIDSYLDPAELADGLIDVTNGLLSEDQVRVLMAELRLDSNQDDNLDFEEFKETWTPDMERSIYQWVQKKLTNDTIDTISKIRVSDQTWLDQSLHADDTLVQLQERVVKLMQLPRDIVVSSESLQVVRYQPGGHYHAHHDSDDFDDNLICSHTEEIRTNDYVKDDITHLDAKEEEDAGDFNSKRFRLCRFATVLFYLNDVEEGGETAFPVADNETFTDEGIDELPYNLRDLTHHCYDGNLAVEPEKGKAILWYNHMVDVSNGWMGALFNKSLHGGCDVAKGVKWIASNWINVDDVYSRQMEYHDLHYRELENGKVERERQGDQDESSSEEESSIEEELSDGEKSSGEDTTDSDSVQDHVTKRKREGKDEL